MYRVRAARGRSDFDATGYSLKALWLFIVVLIPLTACASTSDTNASKSELEIDSFVYQLQDYRDDKLEQIASLPQDLAIIDLARDGGADYFRRDEIDMLHDSGKKTLSYFSIGSLENYRPEYARVLSEAPELIANRWGEWPDENFVTYWADSWWEFVVRPRVDQAISAGFDGVYLDVLLAYEDISPQFAADKNRDDLARLMVDLVIRISEYARKQNENFWIFPQNSPELRTYPGYVDAIDGIGVEDLFFQNADVPCFQDYCQENLDHVRAIKDAGKIVLATDYADSPKNIRTACAAYRREGFAGYVADIDLGHPRPSCR
ncbi:MAG: glycoside hydrolase [Corynebacteriales bacterium]|nr:glycoside hydrolase [Mycobacteriales bacterium]